MRTFSFFSVPSRGRDLESTFAWKEALPFDVGRVRDMTHSLDTRRIHERHVTHSLETRLIRKRRDAFLSELCDATAGT